VHRIINGPFAVPVVEDNRRRFNVYYLTDPTNQFAREFEDADSNATAFGFQAGVEMGGSFTFDAFDLGVFRPEGGQGIFGLADEYACSTASNLMTARFEPAVHGNVFNGLDHCQARSPATSFLALPMPASLRGRGLSLSPKRISWPGASGTFHTVPIARLKSHKS
jgi:hypothetical protein